jgi:hypothetical protein
LESSFLGSFSQEFGSTEILKQISQDRSQEFLISGISEQNLLQSFLKNFEHLACSCTYTYSNKSDYPHYEMLKELQKVGFGTLA